MYYLCDRCKGELEKPKMLKGWKGNICQKCQRLADKERRIKRKMLEESKFRKEFGIEIGDKLTPPTTNDEGSL